MTTSTSATTTATAATNGVDRFLDGVVNATIPTTDAWTDGATLDATVPGWRFTLAGADAIRAKFATWFADVGCFEELRRLPTPGGEVVEYLLTWEEDGVPHAAHHVHLLTLAANGWIADDHFFCGGRWDAALLAEMAAAGA